MKYFTPQRIQPSEKTLQLIRQVARLYTYANQGDKHDVVMCMN